MANERENNFSSIVQTPYDIDGNVFRAYFDAAGNLLFVVDETITADKPNVMLVMDGVAGRKWDDVLSNDYGIDLETVRPRRDNKYQKLDIEYDGLDVYRALIAADDGDGDMMAARSAMARFRIVAARRAATERLDAAVVVSDKARETIARANETISELQARVKELRAKIAQYKKSIGREPTKQTASKILKTEAQIDATNEKLARAKKRLNGAQRRMVAADENAEIARAIMARVADADVAPADTVTAEPTVTLPAMPVFADVAAFADAPVSAMTEPETYESEESEQLRTEEMPDDKEVKPLFDKDPEFLDDEIAFKPIEFNVGSSNAATSVSRAATPVVDMDDDMVAPAPLAFTPPAGRVEPVETPRETTSVLDTIRSVDAPNVVETSAPVADAPVAQPQSYDTPAADNTVHQSAPAVAAAPASSGFRPVSPIKHTAAAPVDPSSRKPALTYYIMLILLIVLSIFTLWFYQKSNRDTTPDLASSVAAQPVVENAATDGNSPFLSDAPAPVTVATPAPELEVQETIEAAEDDVSEPEPEPVPVVVVPVEEEPEFEENVDIVEDIASVDVSTEFVPVQVVDDGPFLGPVEEPKHIPTEEEVLASKPAYNVSQQEKMFVADDNYDTETLVAEEEMDADVAPAPYDMPMCDDGAAPNLYGCCPGEEYTEIGTDEFACCPAGGGDCFPPLF